MLLNFIAIVTVSVFNIVIIFRWWDMRKALALVHEGVLSVAWTASSFMPALEAMDTRKTLVRYSHAIHEFLWKSAHSADDESDDLVSLGFLNATEWNALHRDPQPHMILIHWMTTIVLRAKSQGLVAYSGDIALEEFMKGFHEMKKGSQIIDMHVNTRDAQALTQLVSVLMFLALIMFSMEMGQDAGSEDLQGHAAWIVFDAFLIFVLHLLYHVSMLPAWM